MTPKKRPLDHEPPPYVGVLPGMVSLAEWEALCETAVMDAQRHRRRRTRMDK
jgi:hypothetical protein